MIIKNKCLNAPRLQCPNDKSFTLIELMVSLSILIIAVLAALSIYVNVIGTRQKTLGELNIQEDGQYLMSLIVKDIRAGMVDYSSYGSVLSSPEHELFLLDSSGNQIRYKVTDTTPIVNGACAAIDRHCTLERCENSDCSIETNYQTITMTNISLERLDFYITPTTDPFTAGSTDYKQPRVTVLLKFKSLIERTGENPLVLQQTVPQKYTYRK